MQFRRKARRTRVCWATPGLLDHALCADDERTSETVELDLVAPVASGGRLLAHAGTAITRFPEEASA